MIEPKLWRATLAPGQSISETKIVSIPKLPPKVDILFSFDLTGSMVFIIDAAKARAMEVIERLSSLGVDINYGVASYMDYPHSYTSYGYSAYYGGAGDYSYRLDQSITGDNSSVINAINSLNLGYGADGPQDYTRILYESYADPNVGWRTGAKRFLVNFADNIPHDDNINQDVPGKIGIISSGGDPGRDEIMFTSDDLDLQTVLKEMAVNNVILIEAHASSSYLEYWQCWSQITGGNAFIITSATFVDDLVNGIISALETSGVTELHLMTSSGFEEWLESVFPYSYTGPTGVTIEFLIAIRVPEGTTPGEYSFSIFVIDSRNVFYGEQILTIVVKSQIITEYPIALGKLREVVPTSKFEETPVVKSQIINEFFIALGKLREVVPTGRFKETLFREMREIEILLELSKTREALTVVSTIISKVERRVRTRYYNQRLILLLRDLEWLEEAILTI